MKIIIAVFVIFVVNIWLENASEGLYEDWFAPVLYYQVDTYLIILASICVYKIIQNKFDAKKEKIESLNKAIESYEIDLKEETKALWKSYADLNRFNQAETVQRTMKTWVDNNENVVAVQLYNYVLKTAPECTSITVSHKDGYVSEAESLNALLQEYYELDSKTYKRFKEAMKAIGKFNGFALKKFIAEYKGLLEEPPPDKMKGNSLYSIYYSLVLLGVQSYISYYIREKSHSTYTIDMLDDEKVQILMTNKRTGILRGILNNELGLGGNYIFFHDRNNSKKGRIYFTKSVKLNGSKSVFLFTLFNNIDENNLLEKIDQLSTDFIDLLSKNGIEMEFEEPK